MAGNHWSPGSAASRYGGSARQSSTTASLLAGQCEWCEQQATVDVHQVHKLADLTRPGPSQPAWAQLMARKRRKTLIVCAPCHDTIHARQPATKPAQ